MKFNTHHKSYLRCLKFLTLVRIISVFKNGTINVLCNLRGERVHNKRQSKNGIQVRSRRIKEEIYIIKETVEKKCICVKYENPIRTLQD